MNCRSLCIVNCLAAALLAAGCSDPQADSTPATLVPRSQQAHDDHDHDHGGDHDHDHPSAGPHGGDLIELGGEEYHAEVTHEKNVTVYLLDGAAKAAAPIDAKEVTLNVTHDGEAQQYQLAAQPDANDPEGKASRFVSDDADLLSHIKSGDAKVQLVLTIAGKQYRGALEHEHEHEHDHDHDHDH